MRFTALPNHGAKKKHPPTNNCKLTPAPSKQAPRLFSVRFTTRARSSRLLPAVRSRHYRERRARSHKNSRVPTDVNLQLVVPFCFPLGIQIKEPTCCSAPERMTARRMFTVTSSPPRPPQQRPRALIIKPLTHTKSTNAGRDLEPYSCGGRHLR